MNKRAPVAWLLTVALAALVIGCAGQPRTTEPEPVSLDAWLETEAYGPIVEQLKANSFLTQRPFLIAKTEREQVSERIDLLTEDIRARLVPRLRAHPQIHMVLRHPVAGVDRPYRFQELQCGNFQEVTFVLAIDIHPIGAPQDNLARISIGAIDMGRGEWVEGFSLYRSPVRLTPQQSRDLQSLQADEYLRGLRYLPFRADQQDEMAAYVARNLSCIFRDAYGGPDRKVFVPVDRENGTGMAKISRLLKKQLNFNNEIQLVTSPETADWVIAAEALETGAGNGLRQLWVEVSRRTDGQLVKGLATHAYFHGGAPQAGGIAGTWELRNPTDDRVVGLFRIDPAGPDRYSGNLFTPDGRTQQKLGIEMTVAGDRVTWIYYAPEERKTFEANGVLGGEGRRMAVKLSAIPGYDPPQHLELIRRD